MSLRALPALFLFFSVAVTGEESAPGTDSTWEALSFRIEDSRAFVGFAPVYLTVSELKPEEGYLVGTYEIRVPLKSSKNDHGKIMLPLKAKVDDLGENGGVLRGKAYSNTEEGTVNQIVCEIIPEKNQTIRLAITTDKRTVQFNSRYTVVQGEQGGSH